MLSCGLFDLAATVNIIDIGIYQRFEQHPGMIAAGPSWLILFYQLGNIHPVQYRITTRTGWPAATRSLKSGGRP